VKNKKVKNKKSEEQPCVEQKSEEQKSEEQPSVEQKSEEQKSEEQTSVEQKSEEQTKRPEICYNDLIDINEVLNYSKIVIQDIMIKTCQERTKYEIIDNITKTEKFINFYEKVNKHFKNFLKGVSIYSYVIYTKI
jgi:hypothetical protein